MCISEHSHYETLKKTVYTIYIYILLMNVLPVTKLQEFSREIVNLRGELVYL